MFRGLVTSPTKSLLRARPGATRAMAVALLVVVALAGMGLGFAADRLALRNRRDAMRVRGPAPGVPGFGPLEGRRGGGRDGRRGEGRGEGMRERFARELDLTPEQRRRVDSIMARQMSDFRRIREEMQPRFDSLLVQAQARLDSVLTPAQREKLNTLRESEAFGPRGDSFRMRDFPPRPAPY